MLRQLMKELNDKKFPIDFPGHWIKGQWQQIGKGKNKVSSINPSRNEKLIEFGLEPQAMQLAIDAAEECRASFENRSLADRQQIVGTLRRWLAEYRDAVVNTMCVETGKPRWEAELDLHAAIQHLDYVAANTKAIIESGVAPARAGYRAQDVIYEVNPVGVTAAFIPFSSPITSLAQYIAAAALAGCPLVLVAGHHAILTGILAGSFAEVANIDPGSINVVFGNFDKFKQFFSDRRVKAVVYTGSREHCDTIRRESSSYPGRQLILQSGGKNCVVVDEHAKVEDAVRVIAFGAFKSTGQLCTATSRVFVHQSKVKDLTDALAKFVSEMSIGATDSAGKDPLMGPLYAKKAVEKFLRFQTMAHREEAASIHWGKTVEAEEDGFFVRPGLHLMKDFDPKSSFQSNVLLCPDICIYRYGELTQAIDMVNDTDAPFVMSFVGDSEKLHKYTAQIRIPNIMLNLPTVEVSETTLPLPGRRHSGQHRYSGASLASLLAFPKAWQQGTNLNEAFSTWPAPKF
jgi:succinylglutamic semialdehyde dehydrogenase